MGKVTVVKKSRKERKCNKCGKLIPVGSTYYKGEINFGPTISRCNECKLADWEVTTSDYILTLGEIVYDWTKDYDLTEDTSSELCEQLQTLLDDTQEKLDNMPDQLQESETGQLLQERIDNLSEVVDELENIDIDDFKTAIVDELEDDDLRELNYDDMISDESIDRNIRQDMETSLNDKISDAIEEALAMAEV